MKTKTRTNRRHKRKYSATSTAVSRCSPYSESELVRQKLPARLAYDAIKKGIGTKKDYDEIAYDLNDTTVLSDKAGNQEYVAMVRVLERHQRTGKFGFDGPAIESVLRGIELYEAFLEVCTPAQMIAAGMESNRRVRQVIAAKQKEPTSGNAQL